MKKDFKFYLDRIDNVLLRFSERGNEFFNNTITITNILDLLKSEKLKRDFEEKVVGETRSLNLFKAFFFCQNIVVFIDFIYLE